MSKSPRMKDTVCGFPMPPASAMRNDPLHRLFKAVEQSFREHLLSKMREASLDDLFPGAVPLLLHLGDEDGLNLTELGKRCHLEASTITPLVDELERAGVAVRRRSAEDRRNVNLFLTDCGRQQEQVVRSIVLEMQDAAMSDIPLAELDIMQGVLQRMVNNLRYGTEKEDSPNAGSHS